MESIKHAIRSLITVSDSELHSFLDLCYLKSFKKKTYLNTPDQVADQIYFILRGILRVILMDKEGNEHTIHFSIENQFVTDYASFLQKTPSIYYLQALEETEVVVMPRKAIESGYMNMIQGEKLGRLIAENYFIYHDNRIKDMYYRSAKERYELMNKIFPNIHHRVPQHMIASYIGITPIHLSRLKKEAIIEDRIDK